jgi:glycosyltransferase involved in cell wall biosynthesis
MPELSIIVPVYDVEAYLPECLESVFSQDFRDFEIVAINDGSPDGSLDILRRYQKADARLKVIELEKNGGLGAARNRGLDVAAGRYVLFLDSDDSIVEGALSAMMDRARQTESEVVVFGWTREYEDGHILQGSGRRILAAAPARFTVTDYPRILHVLQIACNKLISRELLERMGLRFVDGCYEDTPFTYPLLVAARSITTLAQPLLRYRQRERAITRTSGTRHVQVLGQWDRAMERVYGMTKERSTVRAYLFPQMLAHCASVLLKHERIPRSAHAAFLRELRRLYWRYRPSGGYQALGRLDRVQHGLLQFASPTLMRAHWKLSAIIRRHVHRSSGQ